VVLLKYSNIYFLLRKTVLYAALYQEPLISLYINILTMSDERPKCHFCHAEPCAVNYWRNGKVHYRRLCEPCTRKNRKVATPVPLWFKSGYRKKPICEKCGFKARLKEQLVVMHLDGKKMNVDRTNLKTVCLNCQVEVKKSMLPWQPADVLPDF